MWCSTSLQAGAVRAAVRVVGEHIFQVPHLAAAPGHMQKGVADHNGRDLHAADVTLGGGLGRLGRKGGAGRGVAHAERVPNGTEIRLMSLSESS